MHILPASVPAERIIIREWTADDVEQFDAAITSSIEHLRPWMPWIAHEPQTIAQRLERISGWRLERSAGGDATYGIFLPTTPDQPQNNSHRDTAIGGTGLMRRAGEGGLEIGYWIHPDHVRRGYATEATRWLIVAAFELPDIERVEIRHDRANVASSRVPDAAGLTMIKESPREVAAPAETGVDWLWRITRGEFEASRR